MAAAAAAALAEMKLCAALLAHYFNEWVPSTLTANCSWAPHFLFLLLPMATGHTVLQSAHIHTAFSYHPDELIYFLDCPLIYRLLDRHWRHWRHWKCWCTATLSLCVNFDPR